MKKFGFALAFLALFPIAAAAIVTKEDIRKLAEAGSPDYVILAYIRAHRPVERMTAADLAELRAAGVSDQVLEALIAAQAEPAPPEAVIPPPTVYYTDPVYLPSVVFFSSSAFFPSRVFSPAFCHPVVNRRLCHVAPKGVFVGKHCPPVIGAPHRAYTTVVQHSRIHPKWTVTQTRRFTPVPRAVSPVRPATLHRDPAPKAIPRAKSASTIRPVPSSVRTVAPPRQQVQRPASSVIHRPSRPPSASAGMKGGFRGR